jgi:hypothetical protein
MLLEEIGKNSDAVFFPVKPLSLALTLPDGV